MTITIPVWLLWTVMVFVEIPVVVCIGFLAYIGWMYSRHAYRR